MRVGKATKNAGTHTRSRRATDEQMERRKGEDREGKIEKGGGKSAKKKKRRRKEERPAFFAYDPGWAIRWYCRVDQQPKI